MKFKVKGNEFSEIMKTVIKGFDNKEDNSYVAFELEEDELTVIARSRATFFQGKIGVNSVEIEQDEPTIYHLDGVKLKQLISILPTAPVDIEFQINDKTRSFTIRTVASKYKLPVLSETPLAPVPEVDEYATVDANDLMKDIKDLIKIVSTDASHQEHQISCMHFKLSEKAIKLSATDSYALGSKEIVSSSIELDEDGKDVLIRHSEVNSLISTFGTGETLTIVGSDEMFGYVDENNTLALVGVINMEPLDTSQIEAVTQDVNTVKVDKGELKNAIETVDKLSPKDQTVDIDISEDGYVRVSNRYGDYIDVTTEESKLESPGVASFATEIILKAINPANDGSLRLEFSNLSESGAGATRIASLQADGSNDDKTSLLATRMAK